MSEPITGSDFASALATGVTLISVFGPQNGPTVIGAFAGAAIFVASAGDFGLLWRLFLGSLSFAVGLVAAPFTTSLLDSFLPAGTAIDLPIGALVASAAAVRILMGLCSKDGLSLLSRFRGGRQ